MHFYWVDVFYSCSALFRYYILFTMFALKFNCCASLPSHLLRISSINCGPQMAPSVFGIFSIVCNNTWWPFEYFCPKRPNSIELLNSYRIIIRNSLVHCNLGREMISLASGLNSTFKFCVSIYEYHQSIYVKAYGLLPVINGQLWVKSHWWV